MNKDKNTDIKNMTDTVMQLLKPMSNLKTMQDDTGTIITKEGFQFCLVNDNQVFLIADSDKQWDDSPVSTEILNNSDQFLREATISYWFASGSIKDRPE